MKPTFSLFKNTAAFLCLCIIFSSNNLFAQDNSGVSFGFRFGTSLTEEPTSILGDATTNKSREYHNMRYEDFKKCPIEFLTGSTGFKGKPVEEMIDFNSLNLVAVASIPLKKHFSLVGEFGYRKLRLNSHGFQHDFNETATSERSYYSYMVAYEYAQLEIPVMVQASTKWRFITPYINVGLSPVINIQAKSITTVDVLSVTDNFKKEMEANNFDTQSITRDIEKRKVSTAFAGALGVKFSIAPTLNLLFDYHWNLQFTDNLNLSHRGTAPLNTQANAQSFSFGLEYKLSGKK